MLTDLLSSTIHVKSFLWRIRTTLDAGCQLSDVLLRAEMFGAQSILNAKRKQERVLSEVCSLDDCVVALSQSR